MHFFRRSAAVLLIAGAFAVLLLSFPALSQPKPAVTVSRYRVPDGFVVE